MAAEVNDRSGEGRLDFAAPSILLDFAVQLEELVAEAKADMLPRAEVDASRGVPDAALIVVNARGEPVGPQVEQPFARWRVAVPGADIRHREVGFNDAAAKLSGEIVQSGLAGEAGAHAKPMNPRAKAQTVRSLVTELSGEKQPRNFHAALCFDAYADIEHQVPPLDGVAQGPACASIRLKVLEGEPPLWRELPAEFRYEEVRTVVQPGIRLEVDAPRNARNAPLGRGIEIPFREVDAQVAPVFAGHQWM